jgi:hypothetical protein
MVIWHTIARSQGAIFIPAALATCCTRAYNAVSTRVSQER